MSDSPPASAPRTVVITGASGAIGRATAVASCLATARDDVGPVDVLVNKAGIGGPKRFVETTEADWDEMIATNLQIVFNTCRAVVPEMLERGETPMLTTDPEQYNEAVLAAIPLRRWGRPEDLVTTVRFAASEEASFYAG